MKTFKFLSVTMGLLALGTMASCSSEHGTLSQPENGTAPVVNLVKAPEINAYSAGRSLSDIAHTYNVNANANMWSQEWDCSNANKRSELTEEDIANIKELLSKGTPTYNNLIIPWENYFVEQIYKGQAPDEAYTATDINGNPVSNNYVTGSDQMNQLMAHNQHEEQVWSEENNWSGAWETVEYEHINNFNSGDNTNTPGQDGCGVAHTGVSLMTDMSLEGITPNNQFGYKESYGTTDFYNNYIIIQYKGEWYVGFDYEMHKPGAQNPDEARDIERDWNFTDWIVRITPAYHNGEVPSEIPQPYDPSNPDGDDENGEETPETPETPATPAVKDEVEVNLSVEEHDGYLASHLSIHVRAVTNVEIIIPLREEYYAQADDLAIVQQHYDEYMVHGGPTQLTYEIIPGHEITLNFEYTPTYIRVWTEGIDEETINYLRKTYNDGITFEIWTYVNDMDLKGILKEDLSQSTIRFLDRTPDLYVNAFMYEPENRDEIFADDCTVSIVDDQRGEYQDAQQGWHYNDSHYNDLYYKNGVNQE